MNDVLLEVENDETIYGERDARKLFSALFQSTVSNRKTFNEDYFYSIRGSLTYEQVHKFFPKLAAEYLKSGKIKQIPSIESVPLYESNCI